MRKLAWILAPLLGLAAFVGPLIIAPVERPYDAPLFPLLRTAQETVGLLQLLLLFLVGLLLGLIDSARPWKLGCFAVILLPAATIAEIFADSTSHNLLPFEFAIYAFYGLLVALGILLARLLRRSPPLQP